jgi:hypothetical protein
MSVVSLTSDPTLELTLAATHLDAHHRQPGACLAALLEVQAALLAMRGEYCAPVFASSPDGACCGRGGRCSTASVRGDGARVVGRGGWVCSTASVRSVRRVFSTRVRTCGPHGVGVFRGECWGGWVAVRGPYPVVRTAPRGYALCRCCRPLSLFPSFPPHPWALPSLCLAACTCPVRRRPAPRARAGCQQCGWRCGASGALHAVHAPVVHHRRAFGDAGHGVCAAAGRGGGAGRHCAGAMLCCAVLCCVVLCCAVLYVAVLCDAVRCGAVRCSAVRCGAVRCGAVRCGAVRWSGRSPFFVPPVPTYPYSCSLSCMPSLTHSL